jgi:uncharacterized membrane protein YidH (DUF202 family)
MIAPGGRLPDDLAPDDVDVPGMAGERTDLAWSRSGLALTVAAAAVLRRLWVQTDGPTGRVIVFSLLGAGALCWCTALWWARVAARPTLEGRSVARRDLRRVTFGTVVFAVAALVLIALPQPS